MLINTRSRSLFDFWHKCKENFYLSDKVLCIKDEANNYISDTEQACLCTAGENVHV